MWRTGSPGTTCRLWRISAADARGARIATAGVRAGFPATWRKERDGLWSPHPTNGENRGGVGRRGHRPLWNHIKNCVGAGLRSARRRPWGSPLRRVISSTVGRADMCIGPAKEYQKARTGIRPGLFGVYALAYAFFIYTPGRPGCGGRAGACHRRPPGR